MNVSKHTDLILKTAITFKCVNLVLMFTHILTSKYSFDSNINLCGSSKFDLKPTYKAFVQVTELIKGTVSKNLVF